MKTMKLVLCLFVLLIPLIMQVHAIDLTSCDSSLTSGTYTLSGDIIANTDTSNCFKFTGSDIDFDCQGFTIDGSANSTTGFEIFDVNNVTVRNCNIKNFWEYGMDIVSVANSNFLDNNIDNISDDSSAGIGIRTENVNLSTFDRIILNNSFSEGMYMLFSNSNVVNSSMIVNSGEIGLDLEGSTNNIFENILVENTGYEGIIFTDEWDTGLESSGNQVYDSHILGNGELDPGFVGGITIIFSYSNLFYNNYINNTLNVYSEDSDYVNDWNTTLNCAGRSNILGEPCIAGNYWANPSGTGFSETCSSSDNATCNTTNTIDSGNIDYLPLFWPPDTTPPSSVSGLADQSNTNFSINWSWTNPTDDFSQSIIYIDGVWQVNTSNASYNAIGLSVNTNYTITVHTKDSSGNVNNTDVNDTAGTFDTINPTFDQALTDQSIIFGLPFSYNVNASDSFGIDTYSIDDIINFTINGTSGIITNNTALPVNNYTLNISVNDTSGFSNSNLVIISVLPDTIYPYFTPIPRNQKVKYKTAFSYDINASDNVGITTYSIDDTTNFAIDSVGLITNNSALGLDPYTLTINVSDPSGNTNSTQITVLTYLNLTFNVTENLSKDVDLTLASANLSLYEPLNITTNMIVYKTTPGSAPASLNILKGVNISVDDATNGNLTWALLKIYYNSTETTNANIDPAKLVIYYWNTTSGSWQVEPDRGVNQAGEFVWANITHFSQFGAFGSAPSTPPPSGGGGGGGSSSSDDVFTITLTENEQTLSDLARNTKIIFDLGGAVHTLTVDRVSSTKIDFSLNSPSTDFSLNVGDEKIIPMGDDKFFMRLVDIEKRKVTIAVKKIVEKKPFPVITTATQPEPAPKEDVLTTEQLEQIAEAQLNSEQDKITPLTGNIVSDIDSEKLKPNIDELMIVFTIVLVGICILLYVRK